jgi:hypothetical protein
VSVEADCFLAGTELGLKPVIRNMSVSNDKYPAGCSAVATAGGFEIVFNNLTKSATTVRHAVASLPSHLATFCQALFPLSSSSSRLRLSLLPIVPAVSPLPSHSRTHAPTFSLACALSLPTHPSTDRSPTLTCPHLPTTSAVHRRK